MEKAKSLKKQPKQKRSQEVVEAILGSTTRILSNIPLAKATTDKIAKLAGVGIGSIYDYFPNKKSIVLALIDSRVQKITSGFIQLLENSKDSPLEELIERSLNFIADNYFDNRFFLREIFALAPEGGRMELLYDDRTYAANELAKHMEIYNDKEPEWAYRKSFLLMHSICGVLEGYVISDEKRISADDLKKEMRVIIKAILEQN